MQTFKRLIIFLFIVVPNLQALSKSIVVGVKSDVNDIRPIERDNPDRKYIKNHIFDNLLHRTFSGTYTSLVLNKWSKSKDQRTYDFILKKDIFFSDGTPVKSKHIFASLKAKNSKDLYLNYRSQKYGKFKIYGRDYDFKAIDDLTFQIITKHPQVDLYAKLSSDNYPYFFLRNKKFIGTKEYKVKSNSNNILHLTKNKFFPNPSANNHSLLISNFYKSPEKNYDLLTFIPKGYNCEKKHKCIFTMPIMSTLLSLNQLDSSIFSDQKLRRSFLSMLYTYLKKEYFEAPKKNPEINSRFIRDVQGFLKLSPARLSACNNL